MPSQNLPGPHSGAKATVTPGDTLARSMGVYGKGADIGSPMSSASVPDPTAAAVASPPTKQSTPLMRARPGGGAPPGPNGSTGSPRDYSNAGNDI